MNAVEGVWKDRIYTPLVTLVVFLNCRSAIHNQPGIGDSKPASDARPHKH
jgi:hypothetical protein